MPTPGKKEGATKEVVTEDTVSKADFDALQAQFDTLKAEKDAPPADTEDKDGIIAELKGRLKDFEADEKTAQENELASTLAGYMVEMPDEQRASFHNAVKGADGGSVISMLTEHITTTKVKPLQDKLADQDKRLEAQALKNKKFQILVPAQKLAQQHFRDHPRAQKSGIQDLVMAFKPNEDGDELIPTEHAPYNGKNPDTGENWTMDTLAEHLAATDTLLAKGGTISGPGGDTEQTGDGLGRQAQYKAAKKAGDADAMIDAAFADRFEDEGD